MRYGIIADIHGNLQAFEQALPYLESVERIFCMGDIVKNGLTKACDTLSTLAA